MGSRSWSRLLSAGFSARQLMAKEPCVSSVRKVFSSPAGQTTVSAKAAISGLAGLGKSGTAAGRFLAQMGLGGAKGFQPLACVAALQHASVATTALLTTTSSAARAVAREELLEVDENDEPPGRIPALSGSQRLSAAAWRRQHEMNVSDPQAPEPAQSFNDTGFPEAILEQLEALGYSAPTQIQAQAWPVLAEGRDLVAIASTGSGKTLGFLLPGMLQVAQAKHHRTRDNDVRMLVLSPTRELARQTYDHARRFAKLLGLHCAVLYGGEPKSKQGRDLASGPDVVIATPGRLLDFVESQEISLGKVQYLVLDEADRMLDMGFEDQLQAVAAITPRNRQTTFFSATWPQDVKAAARKLCRNDPVHVMVGEVHDRSVANKSITQLVKVVEPYDKMAQMMEYLRSKPKGSRIIVFSATKVNAEYLADRIRQDRSLNAAVIHGGMMQNARDRAMESFRSGQIPILVATDVAARGLDVQDVVAVVNYDFPKDMEMYVHRIGRTGRAGAVGESFSLMSPKDSYLARGLVQTMRQAGQEVPSDLEELAKKPASPPPRRGGGGSRSGSFSRSGSSGGGWGGRSDRGSSAGGGSWKDGFQREQSRDSGSRHHAGTRHTPLWRDRQSGGHEHSQDSHRNFGRASKHSTVW